MAKRRPLAAWRYSTVNEGVARFNGILKISEL
jgi:hypothetical protein